MREEHVTQFAVAVGLKELPAEAAGAQVSVLRQNLNTTPSLTPEEARQIRQPPQLTSEASSDSTER